MDPASYDVLNGVVAAQLDRIQGLLSNFRPGLRGSSYRRFVELHLDAIQGIIGDCRSDYEASIDDAARIVIGRKLYRMKFLLDGVHVNVFEYRHAIGRRDLPVGLLHLVDALIRDLLKASADPVIHLDRMYMYSTIPVKDQWSPISAALNVVWTEPSEPVLFNLPGLDASNALLSPILAHEVGHSVVRRNDLVAQVDAQLDVQAVDALRITYEAADRAANVADSLNQFGRWVEELLCDALAAELTGPGLLFSAAVFLPASAAGQSGPDHPDPAQRIGIALEQLARNGWLHPLIGQFPEVMAWLQHVGSTQPRAPSPRETFLRGLVDLSRDAIIGVAQQYVSSSLTWADIEPHHEELLAYLERGIPPAEVDGLPVSAWWIIAVVWMFGLRIYSDTAGSLAEVASDSKLSRFALKTVELTRVKELWQENDITPP